MSVPLPSPSPLTPSTKPIPTGRSRLTPISTPSNAHAPSHPSHRDHSPSSPTPSSMKRSTARSIGFNAPNSAGTGEDNWRERGGFRSAKPERTVGGFEKKEGREKLRTPNGGSGDAEENEKEKEREREKDAESKAALAHVPCRFFRAGACTAGASCPFSHDDGAKKEVCQWFLKGNCKFGHKCALAHVRPGQPISMDRKNKKAAQIEARERAEGKPPRSESLSQQNDEPVATPVPIKSALSSSLQSPPVQRSASSPLREPIGPPPSGFAGATTPGFTRMPSAGPFASSPSRPSPLSASFGARFSVPGPLAFKSSTPLAGRSPLRPPVTAAPGYSSSFSHAQLHVDHGTIPLSASFADSPMRRNIWARADTPEEQLSPARRSIMPHRLLRSHEDVFRDDNDDHAEDLLPSSLSDLLTPVERARRFSRRDSNDRSASASPSRAAFSYAPWNGGERLAQSAGPTMGPAGFLQSLWSADGEDARKSSSGEGGFAFGPSTAQPQGHRQSLLTQQRTPISPSNQNSTQASPISPQHPEAPYLIRTPHDPSSPSAKALQEHAPGQSLPGGLATALSRLHLHGPRASSGLANTSGLNGDSPVFSPPKVNYPIPNASGRKDESHAEEMFVNTMDG